MDFCDVNVRVLYDFEYTTKYGRTIKITCGERLLLIKKTNNDWWQVIRSTEQRPFFVPASYVDEIDPSYLTSNKNQSRTKLSSEKTHPEKNATPACDSQKSTAPVGQPDTIDKAFKKSTVSEKHTSVSDVTKEKTKPIMKTLSSTMSSSGYNSLCEEIPVFDEEEASYSNSTVDVSNTSGQLKSNNFVINESEVSHSENKPNFDNRDDATVDPPTPDKQLSVKRDSSSEASSSCEMIENKLHKPSVVNPRECPTEVSNCKLILTLPTSDSLENLSLQIELKTSSLRNPADINSKLNSETARKNNSFSSTESVVSNNQYIPVQGLKDKLSTNLMQTPVQESKSSENICSKSHSCVDNSNLQYHGSFKTNSERQRWFKKSSSEKQLRNVYSCSDESGRDLAAPTESLRGVNVSTSIAATKENVTPVNTSVISINEIRNCMKIDENYQQSEIKEQVLQKRYYGSDGQLSHLKTAREKTSSHHSLDCVIEGELRDNHVEESEQRRLRSKEFVPLMNVLGTKKAHSEKSSTDSLLDLENDGNFRKISGGTTSDSLIPTDGEDLNTSGSETDSVKLRKNRGEDFKNVINNARKVALTRRKRVFTSKSRQDLSETPPSPGPDQIPSRKLSEGWNEYDTKDGRKYFYNSQTREKRWKPPRRHYNANVETQDERDSNETEDTDDMFVVSLPLPSGWTSEIDPLSGQTCYINMDSGAKWFSSTDSEGRVYFFEENSNKSSWSLPDSQGVPSTLSKVADRKEVNPPTVPATVEKSLNRNVKSRSMVLANRFDGSSPPTNLSQNWPQLWDGTMCVLKEGPMNKTKITENGKRVRKNWTSTHAVLTELLLLFFKDNKGFPAMMNGNGHPELSVDLNGAVIDCGDKVSSRKNVYMVSTVLGLQVLVQWDCPTTAQQWLQAIQAVIENLPSSVEAKGARGTPESPSEENKSNSRIGRSKSMKLKQKSASIEDISVNIAERQTKIRERLKKFFIRRPTVELLVKKGIWKDEPVFGCLLEHTCPADPPRVPLFVQHCIRCIESNEENMKTDGLYRASGNLSQVQKIRLQVDQNIYALLEQEEDVHVLTGTLKLFFRELKQPLIPFKFFNKALHASTNPNRTEKIKAFREIVKSLPPCNHDTLKILLQHLLSVTNYQEYNRMHIANIAIVFGPTLMWPEQESLNMAFDLMQQNLVIECFLSDFHTIFQ